MFCVELAALLKLNELQFYLFGQIQTSQNGGQPYSDTSSLASVLWLLLSKAKRRKGKRRWLKRRDLKA